MEWTIIFGALCTITDCAIQQVERWVLAVGAVMGTAIAADRIRQGREDWYGIVLAVLPGLLLWTLSGLTEGKVGRADGDMVCLLGLMLGWQQCLAVFGKAGILMAIYAGTGLAAGKLKKSSRLPMAPFLLSASCCLWMLQLCSGGMT